jgi:hypothetical protein
MLGLEGSAFYNVKALLRKAIRLIVRRGLGVAACGDANAGNQRHDHAGEQCGCLFHLRVPFSICRDASLRPGSARAGLDRRFGRIAVFGSLLSQIAAAASRECKAAA